MENRKMNNADNKKQTLTEEFLNVIRDVEKKLKTDESFYVVDLTDVTKKYKRWKSKLSRVHPFYAVKTNSELPFLRFMVSLGAHFDCGSKEEIKLALLAGAKPSEIIFAHTYKLPSHLLFARSQGVDLMTFDSEDELLKIKKFFPDARLVLRFGVPDVKARYTLDEKFGCNFADHPHLLKMAHSLGLKVVGTCFHVGAICKDPTAFSKAIQMARGIFNTASNLGYNFVLLDIGGGFHGQLGTEMIFDKMSKCINLSLKEHFPEEDKVQIIAEPGCYFTCSAFYLCVSVMGKRKLKKEGNAGFSEKIMYYLSDGIFGSIFNIPDMFNIHGIPLLTNSEKTSRPIVPSKLWGWTSTPLDLIEEECLLPELKVGERLVFVNMGSYTLSTLSNFNGFVKPVVQYLYPETSK